MEFIDTQIVSYVYKRNTDIYKGNVKGRQISSIVALEFLGIMVKNKNKAKMYPSLGVRLRSFVHLQLLQKRKPGFEIGKATTDCIKIDFNGEFESIVIFSNYAISYLINEKNIDALLFFAKNTLDKEDYKKLRKRAQFLIDNDIHVVPVNERTVSRMFLIYQDIKKEYNVKVNYRNSFMDLLILSTALEKKEKLITVDKELNKVLAKYCKYLEVNTDQQGIASISSCQEPEESGKLKDSLKYVNNGWNVLIRKGINPEIEKQKRLRIHSWRKK